MDLPSAQTLLDWADASWAIAGDASGSIYFFWVLYRVINERGRTTFETADIMLLAMGMASFALSVTRIMERWEAWHPSAASNTYRPSHRGHTDDIESYKAWYGVEPSGRAEILWSIGAVIYRLTIGLSRIYSVYKFRQDITTDKISPVARRTASVVLCAVTICAFGSIVVDLRACFGIEPWPIASTEEVLQCHRANSLRLQGEAATDLLVMLPVALFIFAGTVRFETWPTTALFYVGSAAINIAGLVAFAHSIRPLRLPSAWLDAASNISLYAPILFNILVIQFRVRDGDGDGDGLDVDRELAMSVDEKEALLEVGKDES